MFDDPEIELAAFVINISDEEPEVFNFDFLTSGYRLASYAPAALVGCFVAQEFPKMSSVRC